MNPLRSLTDLDRTVHEPARLMILAILSRARSAEFVSLAHETGLTRGNLSCHMTKLEAAGFVTVVKEFVDRVPRTTLRITTVGRSAFEEYRRHILAALG